MLTGVLIFFSLPENCKSFKSWLKLKLSMCLMWIELRLSTESTSEQDMVDALEFIHILQP